MTRLPFWMERWSLMGRTSGFHWVWHPADEMVHNRDSVDDQKRCRALYWGIRMGDLAVLDAKSPLALDRYHDSSGRPELQTWKNQSGGTKKPKKRTASSRGRQIAYLICEYFRITGANDSVENYADLLTSCSSKWWYSGTRFEMGRNSIINDENLIRWHLGRIVQIKNTRVWETQDRIGMVQCGDSSEESRTWSSQIEDDGKKKYRTRLWQMKNFAGQKWKFWDKRHGQESEV